MGKNVLLVDDSSTMRKIIGRSLRQAGIDFDNIFEAADGLEALDVLEKESVDLVLSDIRMPKVDGVQVLQFIKQSKKFKKLPVIMFTTSNREEEVRRCYEYGCNFYLKKEVDYKKFSEKISILSSFIENAEIPVLEVSVDV